MSIVFPIIFWIFPIKIYLYLLFLECKKVLRCSKHILYPAINPDSSYSTDNLVWINNFDSRTYEEEVGREVWGYVEYSRRLPDRKVANYELIEASRG